VGCLASPERVSPRFGSALRRRRHHIVRCKPRANQLIVHIVTAWSIGETAMNGSFFRSLIVSHSVFRFRNPSRPTGPILPSARPSPPRTRHHQCPPINSSLIRRRIPLR